MINTQHLIHIQLNNEQKWAKVVDLREEDKTVKMQTVNGETFIMKTEGQDTTSGYPTLREAIQRTSPTLVTSGNYACIYMSDKNAFICH